MISCGLFQAVMTMVPEAWQNDDAMPEAKKDFYRWSAFAMEPWDGPGTSWKQHQLSSIVQGSVTAVYLNNRDFVQNH